MCYTKQIIIHKTYSNEVGRLVSITIIYSLSFFPLDLFYFIIILIQSTLHAIFILTAYVSVHVYNRYQYTFMSQTQADQVKKDSITFS